MFNFFYSLDKMTGCVDAARLGVVVVVVDVAEDCAPVVIATLTASKLNTPRCAGAPPLVSIASSAPNMRFPNKLMWCLNANNNCCLKRKWMSYVKKTFAARRPYCDLKNMMGVLEKKVLLLLYMYCCVKREKS